MDNKTLKCNCGETKESSETNSSIQNVRSEGWGVVATFDSKLIKVCPDCYKELKQLADRIFEITDNKYVSLSGLIKR